MSSQRVVFVLVIQIASGVILIAVWIIRKPRQNIGGVSFHKTVRDGPNGRSRVFVSHSGHLVCLKPHPAPKEQRTTNENVPCCALLFSVLSVLGP
jgi:hypothetical protein